VAEIQQYIRRPGSSAIHAVEIGDDRSICGLLRISSGNGWAGSETVKADAPTCQMCIKRLLPAPRFQGVRAPDFWMVAIDGEEESSSRCTEAEAEELAADERLRLLKEWREAEGDASYTGPEVHVEPVWIGDPRPRHRQPVPKLDVPTLRARLFQMIGTTFPSEPAKKSLELATRIAAGEHLEAPTT
jgi:hypothetical protein